MPPQAAIRHLEIAAFTPSSALLALKAGAQRIELCSSRDQDGLTPDVQGFLRISSAVEGCGCEGEGEGEGEGYDGDVLGARGQGEEGWGKDDRGDRGEHKREINVMIRPHDNSPRGPGTNDNFRVGDDIFEKMKEDIRIFRKWGATGFVFGILKDADGDGGEKGSGREGRRKGGLIVDNERCAELIRIARAGKDGGSVRCTFHRAFDRIDRERMEEQLEILTTLTFSSLLTSGGAGSATQGAPRVAQLVRRAAGRIDIIVGGGVRSANVRELVEGTGARWFHSSAVTGEGEEVDSAEVQRLRAALGG
ncbi:hypothetical protein DSL72_002338 [Monilinia vaccinii-corymbosi]|uniref:Copper homeostasis protein cutC homolog n=1 Tax=Monilinia vaccinii-corymbosi TaxID=61207 RepID=A0A8A3PCE2_9HELO|nr:hypothetical protein DSL72_002338 [Monilinia vaccinii-corymbosi]